MPGSRTYNPISRTNGLGWILLGLSPVFVAAEVRGDDWFRQHLPAVLVFSVGAAFALLRFRIEISPRESAVIFRFGLGPYSLISRKRKAAFEAVDIDAQYQRGVSYPIYLRWASAGGRRHRNRLLIEDFYTAKVAIDLAESIRVPIGVSPGFLTYASPETRKALVGHAVLQFRNQSDTVPSTLP